jgi:hypothetical protein
LLTSEKINEPKRRDTLKQMIKGIDTQLEELTSIKKAEATPLKAAL